MLDSGLRFRHNVSCGVASESVEYITLPKKIKVTRFLMIIRSFLMYGPEDWLVLANKINRKRLDTVQSKTLRRVLRQPWYVRNTTVRASASIPALEENTSYTRR